MPSVLRLVTVAYIKLDQLQGLTQLNPDNWRYTVQKPKGKNIDVNEFWIPQGQLTHGTLLPTFSSLAPVLFSPLAGQICLVARYHSDGIFSIQCRVHPQTTVASKWALSVQSRAHAHTHKGTRECFVLQGQRHLQCSSPAFEPACWSTVSGTMPPSYFVLVRRQRRFPFHLFTSDGLFTVCVK